MLDWPHPSVEDIVVGLAEELFVGPAFCNHPCLVSLVLANLEEVLASPRLAFRPKSVVRQVFLYLTDPTRSSQPFVSDLAEVDSQLGLVEEIPSFARLDMDRQQSREGGLYDWTMVAERRGMGEQA